MEPPRASEPQASAEELGINANMNADRQHKHRDLWVALSVALILGGPGLAVAIWAAENSQPHTGSGTRGRIRLSGPDSTWRLPGCGCGARMVVAWRFQRGLDGSGATCAEIR